MKMKRLTVFNPIKGEYDWSPETDEIIKEHNDPTIIGQRVREYVGKCEDANVSPEEITALKADNALLRAENIRLKYVAEEMTYIIQQASYKRCGYCILRTEPCPERGLNAECCFEYAGSEEST